MATEAAVRKCIVNRECGILVPIFFFVFLSSLVLFSKN